MNVEATFPARGHEENDPRPLVALPRPGLPGAAIAAITLAAAVILFLILDGRRQEAATRQLSQGGPATAFTPPPPLTVPQVAPAEQFATIYPMQPRQEHSATPTGRTAINPTAQPAYSSPITSPFPEPSALPIESELPAPPPIVEMLRTQPSYDGPAVVIGSAVPLTSIEANRQSPAVRPQSEIAPGSDGAAPAAATLTRIANPATLMPAGTLIPSVLETPIDTSRPGLVRAIVSKDAKGFGGREVLVPRGSRLIGEYQSDIAGHQNRVLVSWTRLIRPDGVSVRLAAPATDSLGGAGIPGRVHNYFLSNFFNSVFQTALAVGENLASRQTNTVIVGLPNGTVTNVAGQSLVAGRGPQRKITVKQGTLINVFVAQDLDFSSAAAGN